MQKRDRESQWHTDEWWMRLSEGEVSEAERIAWQTHLQQCQACRTEWEAWQEVERRLTQAPLPQPATDLTEATLARWHAYRRRRRLLILAAIVAATPMALVGYTFLVGYPFLFLVEALRQLAELGSLLLPMLAQALVAWSVALGASWPWFVMAGIVAVVITLLDSSLLAGSVVLIRRRLPRR